jgi:hypothetical protein
LDLFFLPLESGPLYFITWSLKTRTFTSAWKKWNPNSRVILPVNAELTNILARTEVDPPPNDTYRITKLCWHADRKVFNKETQIGLTQDHPRRLFTDIQLIHSFVFWNPDLFPLNPAENIVKELLDTDFVLPDATDKNVVWVCGEACLTRCSL